MNRATKSTASVIAGLAGTRISSTFAWWRRRISGGMTRFLAALWPWALVVYFAWVTLELLLGYFATDPMLAAGAVTLPLTFLLLLLSIITAFANDALEQVHLD